MVQIFIIFLPPRLFCWSPPWSLVLVGIGNLSAWLATGCYIATHLLPCDAQMILSSKKLVHLIRFNQMALVVFSIFPITATQTPHAHASFHNLLKKVLSYFFINSFVDKHISCILFLYWQFCWQIHKLYFVSSLTVLLTPSIIVPSVVGSSVLRYIWTSSNLFEFYKQIKSYLLWGGPTVICLSKKKKYVSCLWWSTRNLFEYEKRNLVLFCS